MARRDEINWGELLLFGSVIGNLVQLEKGDSTKQVLQQKEQQLNTLLHDRQALLTHLRNFQHAVENFQEKVRKLEDINADLLQKNEELQNTNNELVKTVARLTSEKTP